MQTQRAVDGHLASTRAMTHGRHSGDFGISRALTSTNALAKTQCGTPLFMSPELASGQPYDTGVDVWALGCVLYSLMTLREPWHDRVGPRGSMMELMRIITTQNLDLSPLKSQYSRDLCSLLGGMLSKPASKRPSCKALLSVPLVQRGLTAQGVTILGKGGRPSPSERHKAQGAPTPAPPPPKSASPAGPPHDAARPKAMAAAQKEAAAMPKAANQPPAATPPTPKPPPRPPRKEIQPSPPPSNCAPPVYSQSQSDATPATLTFGAVPPLPPARVPLPRAAGAAANAVPRRGAAAAARAVPTAAAAEADEGVEGVAFGSDAHVAAEALQRSVRRKRQQQRQPPRPPSQQQRGGGGKVLTAEEYRAQAMAKIEGLLGDVREIREGQERAQVTGAAPAHMMDPVRRKQIALAEQRRELAQQREAEEAAIQKQRANYERLDAERAAERAEKAQKAKRGY